MYACEGNSLEIQCDEGTHINLIRANFGRFSISVCNEQGNVDWSVNCMAHRSFRVIQERYVVYLFNFKLYSIAQTSYTNIQKNLIQFMQNIITIY